MICQKVPSMVTSWADKSPNSGARGRFCFISWSLSIALLSCWLLNIDIDFSAYLVRCHHGKLCSTAMADVARSWSHSRCPSRRCSSTWWLPSKTRRRRRLFKVICSTSDGDHIFFKNGFYQLSDQSDIKSEWLIKLLLSGGFAWNIARGTTDPGYSI